jgi:hypothetical protein
VRKIALDEREADAHMLGASSNGGRFASLPCVEAGYSISSSTAKRAGVAMHTYNLRSTVLVITLLALAAGCATAPVSGNSPVLKEKLQSVSANYTGCPAGDNVISDVNVQPGNSGTWTATCQGNVFNCVAYGAPGASDSFTCRPATH